MIGNFTKNTIITFLGRLATLFFGALITILIARALGPEKQGIFAAAVLLPSLILIFTNCGISFATTFFVSKKRYSLESVVGTNIFFTVILSLFALFSSLVIIFFFSQRLFPGIEKIYLFLGLLLIPFSFFFEYFLAIFLGLQKIKTYNFISFLQALLQLIFVSFFLFLFQFKIKGAIFSQILSLFFVCLILFWLIIKETKGHFKFNREYFWETLKYGLKSHLSGVFTFLHYRIDQLLIIFFLNPISLGFYAISTKLAEGIWFLSQAVATPFFPRVASETDQENIKKFTPLVFRNLFYLTLFISILLFFLSDWLIKFFFSEKFLDSILPFKILLVGTFFVSLWRILANDLFARNLPMLNAKISGLSFLTNVFLNILLIPRYGISGAAIASTLSYSLMFFITFFQYKTISGNKIKDLIFLKQSDFLYYLNLLKLK